MLRTVTKFPDLLCSCFTRFSGHCFWRSHEVLHSQINIKFNNHHLFIFCAFLNSSKGPSQGTSFYWALLYWASRILHLCVCVCVCVCVYKLKVCGNCALSKSISTIFPALFAHFVSHFDNSSNISILCQQEDQYMLKS